jgi:polysaccharide deacetylase family protein (PEP-CTERM system associated)
MEEGFKYDSSIFPIHHDFYGFPQAPRFPFLISMNGNNNFEFSPLNFDLHEPQSSVLSPSHSVLNSQSSVNASNSTNPINSSNPTTSSKLIEFPISTLRICGQNLPISGGGYFRLFPYPLIKKGLRRINEEEERPFIFYIHPWEIDPDQPRINSISRKSRFRHYVNLHKTESKFKKLLTDFRFSSLKNILKFNNIFVRIEEGMV